MFQSRAKANNPLQFQEVGRCGRTGDTGDSQGQPWLAVSLTWPGCALRLLKAASGSQLRALGIFGLLALQPALLLGELPTLAPGNSVSFTAQSFPQAEGKSLHCFPKKERGEKFFWAVPSPVPLGEGWGNTLWAGIFTFVFFWKTPGSGRSPVSTPLHSDPSSSPIPALVGLGSQGGQGIV